MAVPFYPAMRERKGERSLSKTVPFLTLNVDRFEMKRYSQLTKRVVSGVRRRLHDAFWRAVPGADAGAFVSRPFSLVLEFTNLCNANCIFCPYSQQTRPHEQMSEQIFKKAVQDYVALGGGSVELTPTVGDPLIHPKFVEWVRYLRSIPEIDQIGVTTNGILLDRHGLQAILDAGLSRINISLAGFDEAMYRRVYRSNAYKKVRKNVEELLALNSSRAEPIKILLHFRPDRPEEEVLADPDMQPLLRYRSSFRFIRVFSRSGGMISEVRPGMQLATIPAKAKSLPCWKTYTVLVVQSNGDVQACGCESSINAPALIVGNVERQSLQEIWSGTRLLTLRQSFIDGSLNANCSSCDYYYEEPGFHLPARREMAKTIRRRSAGEIVRHVEPPSDDWLLG